MYARVLTSGLYGLLSEPTWVEVNVENGLPNFTVVGLANQSIKEAKERIHAAVGNCGYRFPDKRITVNLSPANKKKEGSHFDLPIAVGLLMASGAVKCKRDISRTAFLGELTLDGRLAAAEGVLPMAIGLKKQGIDRVVIPACNRAEAGLLRGLKIAAANSLKEVADFIGGGDAVGFAVAEGFSAESLSKGDADFADIKGQYVAKRAAQVAAAGGHGLLFIGAPGVGKSLICKRIPGIMPPLSWEEQLEVTQIYSVAGELSEDRPMVSRRPFRAPHHSMSAAALAGGGSRPRPGEISLSHCGVLFLDELPEFSARVLESLRQPMEDGEVTVSRVNGKCTYPARFMLIAAMNPCRCGYFGDPVKPCSCTESDRKKYMSRISGPLLDRIDMHAAMERTVYEDIAAEHLPEKNFGSAALREGVVRACEAQKQRYKDVGILNNSQLTPALIDKFCALSKGGNDLMRAAFSRYSLSARSYHRILRVARTIADLDGGESVGETHILEALSYRMPEKFFG